MQLFSCYSIIFSLSGGYFRLNQIGDLTRHSYPLGFLTPDGTTGPFSFSICFLVTETASGLSLFPSFSSEFKNVEVAAKSITPPTYIFWQLRSRPTRRSFSVEYVLRLCKPRTGP